MQVGESLGIYLGIQPSFALSTEYYQISITGQQGKERKVEERYKTEDDKKLFKQKRVDIALTGGLEYTFGSGLRLGFRIVNGLLDQQPKVKAEKQQPDGELPSVCNRGYQLYIGYDLFKLL